MVIPQQEMAATPVNSPAAMTRAATGNNAPAAMTSAATGNNPPAAMTRAATGNNAPAAMTSAATGNNSPAAMLRRPTRKTGVGLFVRQNPRALPWTRQGGDPPGPAILLFCVLLLCVALLAQESWAGSLQVRTDRQTIHEEDSFRLIFETSEEVNAAPDFAPLTENFEILSKQQGSSFQSINGKRSHKITWTVTLLPKRAGSFTIPAIAFGRDRSPELTVTIQQGTAPSAKKSDKQSEDLFLEVSATPEKVYVQAQVVYTVRFFRSVEISGASLTEPQLSASDAVIEKLGEDHTYETDRNNVHYLVVERRYALFPQRSGRLTIAPLRLEVQMGKRGLFTLFDDTFAPGNSGVKRRHSAAVELEVEPIPAAFQGRSWLPAHRLQLMEKWSENPPQFQVGEAITRTLTILADGLTSAQLPEIADMTQKGGKSSSQLKLYPDQPALTDQKEQTGIIGMRQEKVAMVPVQPGQIILPAIEIPWWNMVTQSREVARLPERTVTVTASSTTAQTVPPPGEERGKEIAQNTPPVTAPSSVTDTALPKLKQDSVTEAGGAGKENVGDGGFGYPGWLVPFLAIGWGVTLLAIGVRHYFPATRRPVVAREEGDLERQADLLKDACLQSNPEKCRAALLLWAQARWPGETIRNINDLQRFLKRFPGELLSQEVSKLQQVSFAATAKEWSGQMLWDAVVALPKVVEENPVERLPPLYS
ncbi:MAG: BatD family protein [Magnetococcus sp. YQC-3]